MEVVIIEDEIPAASRLARMLQAAADDLHVAHKLDSVESSVRFFQSASPVDLVFMDIQLADGLSFDIFSQVNVPAPVIFTTAFDQYTLKAFKVNSVDYLLKPIDEQELTRAIEKFRSLHQRKEKPATDQLLRLVQEMNGRYRERLLLKKGQQLGILKVESLAYCFADGKLCYAVDFQGNKSLLETTLMVLEEQLNPARFFRVSRNLLVNIDAIRKVHTWLGGRLKLDLHPPMNGESLVSRERVNDFKEWLGR